MNEQPAGFRTEPNPDVSTASPAPTGAAFRAADRQIGWLVVNRWTYRPLRVSAKAIVPSIDETGVSIRTIHGAARGMLVITPHEVRGDGAVLLIHGGGFVVGSNSEARLFGIDLARNTGLPVYCPAYRLAPEHPFPAGLDDCHDAWTWLRDRAEHFGIDRARIVVGGISAGGGHAASLVQRLHDEGGVQPAGQLLVYPMLDDRTAANTELDDLRHRVWSNANNRFGWSSYLGHEVGRPSTAPYVVPARREDLSGLPPAWIGVGGADLFLDEDRTYTRRLREAGVAVDHVEVDGGIHGFDVAAEAELTRAFYASGAAFVTRVTSA